MASVQQNSGHVLVPSKLYSIYCYLYMITQKQPFLCRRRSGNLTRNLCTVSRLVQETCTCVGQSCTSFSCTSFLQLLQLSTALFQHRNMLSWQLCTLTNGVVLNVRCAGYIRGDDDRCTQPVQDVSERWSWSSSNQRQRFCDKGNVHTTPH